MTINQIDSNDAGLAITQETSIGVLAGSPVWYALEPNSYSDFGGDITLVQRAIIGSRKNQKGSVTGIDVKAGFNMDFTKGNFLRVLQGFFANAVSQKGTSQQINSAGVSITAVATSDDSYAIVGPFGIAKNLMLASGFTNSSNNGLKHVLTATGGKITVSENLTDEAGPPATARLDIVGVEFASGDVALTYAAPVLTLTSTAFDLTTLGLSVGEWIFIGGDGAGLRFATSVAGYARIGSIAAHAIVLDKTTFTPVADAGTGKTIQIFFGDLFKDGATTTKYSYTLERQMGNDGTGICTEQVNGCGPNEITLNAPKKDKFNADVSFVGINEQSFAGSVGIAAGTRVAALGEDAYNTSSDVYRIRINSVDPTTLNPTSLFGYSTTFNLKLSNGLTVDEAVGKVGGFDFSYGQLTITGQLEAYFTSVAAIQAVRNKTPQTIDMIVARGNAGWIFDVPYCEVSGALAKIEKNKPIMLPINGNAVQSSFLTGYVMLFNHFYYLPTIAMPT